MRAPFWRKGTRTPRNAPKHARANVVRLKPADDRVDGAEIPWDWMQATAQDFPRWNPPGRDEGERK